MGFPALGTALDRFQEAQERENAFAYPGRRRLATTWSRYSPQSAGRRPAYSFGRYDFQEMAAHGGAMATRSRRCCIMLVLPLRTNGPGSPHCARCARALSHPGGGAAKAGMRKSPGCGREVLQLTGAAGGGAQAADPGP